MNADNNNINSHKNDDEIQSPNGHDETEIQVQDRRSHNHTSSGLRMQEVDESDDPEIVNQEDADSEEAVKQSYLFGNIRSYLFSSLVSSNSDSNDDEWDGQSCRWITSRSAHSRCR